MIKFKTFIATSILIVAVLLCGCYIIYNSIFPMADPIELPNTEDINNYVILNDSGDIVSVADFGVLYSFVKSAIPTRIMSVNDYPSCKPYYEIVLNTDYKVYRFYIYSDNGNYYLEIPYEDVYKLKIS